MLWRHLFRKKSSHPACSVKPVSDIPIGYALEARMLFDGAIAATTEQTTEAQTTTTQTTTMQTASADTSTQVDGSHVDGTTNHIDSSSSGTSTQTPASGNSEAVAVVGGPPHKEVVFVDMSVADYQTLVNQVPIGTEVVLLDSSKDGLTQMAAWAQTHSDYNAIHIISHGSEGRLYLGGMTLDSSNVASRQSDLIALSAALIPNGDILLYGCSVASGEGESFVSAIASTTGVDVAASSDLTGNLSKGGNWTLEKSVGTDGIPADALTFSHYNEMLTIVTFDNNDLNSNSGIYNKTVSSVGFTFTGADGYSFANNYGTNYNVFPDAAGNGTGDATKVTIEVNSGYTFDLTSFGYYTTVTDTIRVTFTYANNTTVTGTLTATTNTNITLSDFSVFRDGSNNPLPVSANDVIKVVISSENGTGGYDFGTNNFDISDVKAISSTNATSTLTAGAASEATTFSTTVTSVANASSLLDFTITDTGASDGVATTVNALYANVSGSATSSELSQMTFLLSGPDATNVVGTYDSNTGRVTFSGLNVSIADGSSETYTIKAYYNDNTSNHDITDHHTVILSINASNVTTGSGSSTFASSQANVTNDSGASIDVAATKLIYSQSPSTAVVSGINFTSQPVVIAVDDRGNIDTDFNGSVTLSENGSGSLTGTTQVIASNGIATFSGVKYTSASDADANFVLTAAAGSLVSVASASINPDVVATRLFFSTQPVPTTIQDGQSASFTTVPVVQAVDANGMVDQDYTTNIVLSVTDPNDSTVDGTVNSLTVTSGDHDASATTVTLTPSGGIATYTGLIIQYTNSGSINTLALRATSGLLLGVNSSSITSTSNTAPVFSNLNGGATFTEKGSVVVMDNDVTVADTELNNQGNYNGASISIARNGGANNVDTFGNSGLLGGLTQGQNFTYNGLAVGTVTANSSGTLTLTFNSNATSPIVNAVLQSLTYANSSDDPPSSVTLNWTFNDGSLNSSGTNQAVLSITPVNDTPVISNTSVSKTVNEDSAQTFNPADFGFSDVDSGDTLQSITIVTAPSAGELFIDANNDGVRGVGDTLLGNGAMVSAANISKLTFRPHANANGAGYAAFTWQVSDGTALSANTGTMTFNVTPVNDAPVISNTSVSKTVNEDSVQTFNPADFGFSDVDSGDTLQSITIVTAPTAGELFIDANNDGVRGVGDTLLVSGAVVSAADISKMTFRPTANANGAGYAAFTWQVSDGTALSANTGTMTLNVTPVNDAPVISNTSVSKTVNEDSAQTFNPADFGFSDVDSSDTLQSITIVTAPAAGELFIDADNDGVRDSGDTLLGNGAVVSAADISKLTFRPTANANGAGYAAFTWQVSDGTALSTNTETMTLNVTPVNDAPVISNTSVSKTVNEDSAQTFNPADFGFSDVDSSDTLQSITIVTAPTAGELFIDANSNGVRDSGDTLLSNGAVVSAADISKLTFRPTANANGAGYASFTWRVSDGTALSANTGTMTLNVTPVNDAPTLSSGDPQFRISDGANGSRPVDSPVPTIQSQVAGTPPLNTWITSSSLGSFNAGHTAGSSSIMASIFTATSDGVSREDATKSDVANIFRHGSSFSSHFESSLGSFPSFSKDPAQGGTSSLASVFSDIYLPSLTPMEVFTGGSWKDITLHAQGATELGPEQATTAFPPSFPRQLQHIGEAEGQRLSAIAQALFEQSQLQG
ncbi:DUF4347 domain-containing protein [Plesiomonas shigelloides]|uniref:DUF4347 domain-containing protein n=1 Tax=Plesiomonas shigelloides TaxID=703 RepID=UPI00126269D6|nr:DUF4347 domain-containing protein [Plesiomonas shigelloides]KAB7689666.1 DUF4347 domain-containing protein [Plesiomonas shigelloides]